MSCLNHLPCSGAVSCTGDTSVYVFPDRTRAFNLILLRTVLLQGTVIYSSVSYFRRVVKSDGYIYGYEIGHVSRFTRTLRQLVSGPVCEYRRTSETCLGTATEFGAGRVITRGVRFCGQIVESDSGRRMRRSWLGYFVEGFGQAFCLWGRVFVQEKIGTFFMLPS